MTIYGFGNSATQLKWTAAESGASGTWSRSSCSTNGSGRRS
jgi:hypothetical protein